MTVGEALTCLVLSDGRRGIQNQALGLAEACASLRSLTILNHHIANNRAIVALPPKAQLRVASFDLPDCDIAIGCGRQAIAPLLWLRSKRPEVFTVYVQDPRLAPENFDLVIAPEHDGVSGSNVITMIGSPNRISENKIIGETLNFAQGLANLPMPRAAFMVGGDSKTHKLTKADHSKHMAHAQALLNEGYSILVSTSRRTPDFVKAEWLAWAKTDQRIWLYDGEGPNPYFAFLGGADLILVTEDSTNMLTEACATGKPVYRLNMTGKPGKFKALYEALEKRCGAVRYDGYTESKPYEALDETAMAARELWTRFDLAV